MEEAAGSGTAGGQSKIRTERAGASCQNCAPAFFTFTGSASFSVGLSAWRSAVSSRRYGNAWFRSGRRKQIIRTHLLSEKGSDYIGLVRLTGVEPVRPSGHKHLKLASLPIPAQPRRAVIFRPLDYYTVRSGICQPDFADFILFPRRWPSAPSAAPRGAGAYSSSDWFR